jgi:aryl-alcohol dehydrogenase-like predicted oxidoreductase
VSLGRANLHVMPLGLGSSYGVGGADLERAFERGINYMYWGSYRSGAFAKGLRAIAAKNRDGLVLVVQSYTRAVSLMRGSLLRALRSLGTDHADLFLLGWWNQAPPRSFIDEALKLQAEGLTRAVMISSHNRNTFKEYIGEPGYGAVMVRYNAAHPGAEREVFPHLQPMAPAERPGVVAYTATRWGNLVDPKLTPPGEPTPRASDCYRFALSDPHVNVVLAGPRNGAELDEAMQALDRGPLSEDEQAWMRRVGAHIRAAKKRDIQSVGDRLMDWVSNVRRRMG